MSNGNGTMKLFTFVGSIIGGVIAVIAIIYTTVYNPLHTAVAEEANTRQAAIDTVEKNRRIDMKERDLKQDIVNNKILEKLQDIDKKQAVIITDLKYIKGS